MRRMRLTIRGGLSACSSCGRTTLVQGFSSGGRISHIMERENICYECAVWNETIARPPEHMEVLGHECLRICPVADKKDKSNILGGRGKRRFFIRNDGSLLESNDIWNVGHIPERFRERLPPTVREITRTAYKKLANFNGKCRARACLDRYNCYRYDTEVERESGPYNRIPVKWHEGDEHCVSFISKKDMDITNNKTENEQ